jgi:hypothetical protein
LLSDLIRRPKKIYPVIARYANEPSHLKPDTDAMPRGLSFKVFEVEGERIDTATYGDTKTQDFLMNNAPAVSQAACVIKPAYNDLQCSWSLQI